MSKIKNKQKQPKPVVFREISEMPFCTMSLADTTWNNTGTWRYLRPQYVERIPACQGSCPTGNNIESWIRLFQDGKTKEAWDALTLENPFPAITGRVCYHPCQDGCNRKELGGAVSIQMIERALADEAGCTGEPPQPLAASSTKKVAVIGSGPAGLSCAYHLRRLGHNVMIIDRQPKAGGVLRYGIPEYRLPKEILDIDIERLKKMGVEFQLGKTIRDAVELQSLLQQQFNAVFLAAGAHKSRSMGVAGEKTHGVMAGLEFLGLVAHGKAPNIGKKVLVIGGGNTAVDAARVARRLGADVKILYRRSRAEMPAFEAEIKEAEAEGVSIEILVLPKKVLSKDAKVAGIVCDRAELGEPDDSGRRQPVAIPDSECTFDADFILCSIGEDIETSIIPSALTIRKGSLSTKSGGRTEWSNVFAGGDFILQPRTVVDALAAGKRSAIAIDCFFNKRDFEKIFDQIRIADSESVRMSDYITVISKKGADPEKTNIIQKRTITTFTDLNPVYFWDSKPNEYPTRPAEERLGHNNFAEIHLSPPKNIIEDELSRCFHCGRCIQCDNCYIYCPDVSIEKAGSNYDIEYNYCKGCGICVHECPRAAMEMIGEPTEF